MKISELHLVSLAAVFWMSRNALLGRALRDIQKTATRETKLPQTLFQSKDKYKAIDMKTIFYFSCKWNLFSQEKFCTWPHF